MYQGHCKHTSKINKHRISWQTGSCEKRSWYLLVPRVGGFVGPWVSSLLFALRWYSHSCSLCARDRNTPETCASAVTLPNPFCSEPVFLPSTQWATSFATPSAEKCLRGSLGWGCLHCSCPPHSSRHSLWPMQGFPSVCGDALRLRGI